MDALKGVTPCAPHRVASDAGFDALYRESVDPWGTHTRWYERRKRALLMASLPRHRYENVYEAGCGTGHVSVELAPRATRLLASDASRQAVAIASRALAAFEHASVEHHVLPRQWPRMGFDLIVLSEVLYFMDDDDRVRVAHAARASAGADGTVVACNWRHEIDGWGHRGDDVHRRFEAELGLPRLYEYRDDDFVLTGWSAERTSTAALEGLR